MKKLLLTAAAVLLSAVGGNASLTPKVTISGKIKLSIDAAGTNHDCVSDPTYSHCRIRAEKPSATATVKRVFMAAASTGSSGYSIATGNIKLDGASILWEPAIPSNISSYNVWAELTASAYPAIFSKLNAAAPGLIYFTVVENPSYEVDGEILVVVWDDPAAPQTTVSLMYGAQSTGGDAFSVTLASPVDKTNPATVLDMSLGISYGYQPSGQYSILELGINGTRISTSAGGQDDGEPENGALITVGGIDDSNANPPDPYQTDSAGPRYDDELYNLLPFVSNGATSFTVNTHNPSGDDNIFFAAIVLGNNTASIGEGITLGPLTSSGNVGTTKAVQATVQNSLGQPILGRSVTFTVTSGANFGRTATAVTNASGVAAFSYSSSLAGSDTLTATMTNSFGDPQSSNTVTISWLGPAAPTRSVFFRNPSGQSTPVNQTYTLTAKVVNSLGQAQAGVSVKFEATAGPNTGVLGTAATDSTGIATLTYTSSVPGTDTLEAEIAGPIDSSPITHNWVLITSPTLFLSPEAGTYPINGRSTMSVKALDAAGAPVVGQSFSVATSGGPNHPKTLTGVTGAGGIGTVYYSSTLTGTDTWSASATISGTPKTSGAATSTWSGLLCDINLDSKVNIDDIILIRSALNSPATPGDPRDSNFDGIITMTDATACVARCTKSGCAR